MHRRYLLVFAAVLAVVGLTAVLVISRGSHRQRAGARPTPAATATVSPAGRSPRPSPTPVASPRSGGTTSPAVPGPGGAAVSAPLRGHDIEAIPTGRTIVALTFDAGANADGLPAILAALAADHVPATFFLTGDFAARYPASVRAIVAGGHRLANHSATHPRFTDLTDAQIRDQITRAQAAIRASGGTDPRPLFRFPYGDRDARTIAAVNTAGYACVRWTVDTLGWKGTGGGDATAIVTRVLAAARPGEIVLMHIGSNPDDHTTLDADALPAVITRLTAAGYTFVTLDTLL